MLIKIITETNDTLIGMRLSGIDGVLVKTNEDVIKAYNDYSKDSNIGLILITEQVNAMCEDFFNNIKLNVNFPLIAVVPGCNSDGSAVTSINKYINEAIGIKL